MRKQHDRRAFIQTSATLAAGLAFVPGVAAGCKPAASSKEETAKANEDDFTMLFDGETLAGWHTNPEPIGHGTGGQWTVEDGVIVGQQDPPGSGNGGILLTDQEFGDFELLLDMKPDWGPDSGVFLRSTPQGQSFQMMVDYHDRGNVGHIHGEGLSGFNTRPFRIYGKTSGGKLTGFSTKPFDGYEEHPLTYTCTPEAWIQTWKIGDWNRARVRCAGTYPTITTWINGTKVCTFDGATYAHPKYDKQEVARKLGRKGAIALQVHGGKRWPKGAKCRWKNIMIKAL